jgi:hypothetical protein
MLELALSLTLLGTVLIALNRFALGGLSASATNIEMADIRRQVAYTQQLLRADLAAARACDTAGYGTPVLRLDGDSSVARLAVYTTATADGSAQLVEWRFYPDGIVYRISTAREWGDLCEARIPLSIGALRPDLDAEPVEELPFGEQVPLEVIATARNVFAVRLSGTYSYLGDDGAVVVATRGDYPDLCVGPEQSRCYVDQIQVDFTTVTSGSEPVATPFGWTFPVELANARL